MSFKLASFKLFAIDGMSNFMKQKIEGIALCAFWRPDYEAGFSINLSAKIVYRALVGFLLGKQPGPIILEAKIYSNFVPPPSLNDTTFLCCLCVASETNTHDHGQRRWRNYAAKYSEINPRQWVNIIWTYLIVGYLHSVCQLQRKKLRLAIMHSPHLI